jgi:hypothetical protein
MDKAQRWDPDAGSCVMMLQPVVDLPVPGGERSLREAVTA